MANNLAEVYRETAQKYGEKPAFFSKDEKKKYKPVSYKHIHENGIALAEELINMGVNARENIDFECLTAERSAVKRVGRGGSNGNKKEYKLTPKLFKLCLMRSIKENKYAN